MEEEIEEGSALDLLRFSDVLDYLGDANIYLSLFNIDEKHSYFLLCFRY